MRLLSRARRGLATLAACCVLAAVTGGGAVVVAGPVQAATSTSPAVWTSACTAAGSFVSGTDQVQLAPTLTGDHNPDGTPVKMSPDRRGRYVPIVMVHGWISQGTHDVDRRGTFSSVIDLTASRLGTAPGDRSLIGQLQRIPGAAVFTFDYRDYAARWVDDEHLGPVLGKVIDCLYAQSGEKVIVVGHSMGGLLARYAVNQPAGGRADRSAEVSTVVTFGTPETGSVAALLSNAVANTAAVTGPTLAVIRLLLAACGQLSGNEVQTGTLCDKIPAPVRTFDSAAGVALRAGSAQLAGLQPFPAAVHVDALAGNAAFSVPKIGWFALPWDTSQISTGDLIVTSGSALDPVATHRSALSRTITCAYQLSPVRAATDRFLLNVGQVSQADVAAQPLGALSGPCFHTALMRSIELTNEATGVINDDLEARQPKPIVAVAVKVPSIGLPNYQTSGTYPQLTGGAPGSLTAVNAALRQLVLDDQQSYRDRHRQAHGTTLDSGPYPGTYQLSFTPKLMTASPTVISTMYPSLKLYPGGNDGSSWLSLTAAIPDGRPLALTELLTPGSGLPALAAALLRELRATNKCAQDAYADTSPFGQISRDGIEGGVAPTAANYAHFAFTQTGLDIGIDQGVVGAEACGSFRVSLPWAISRPLLNATGQRLYAGLG